MSDKRISKVPIRQFVDDDFKLNVDKLKVNELIGKGAFSTVHKGTYDGIPVAVKKQTIPDKELEAYIRKELGVLERIKSDKLVEFVGAIRIDATHIYIVTEYCVGGNLRRLIMSKEDLGWRLRVNILKDVAEALQYMHDRDLIHRDIKAENVLLDKDLKPKLCDFGFARQFEVGTSSKGRPLTLVGTDEYMAPEIIFGMEYNEKADIFSFGVVMAEVIARKIPGSKDDDFLVREPKDGFAVDKEKFTKSIEEIAPPQSLYLLCEECLSYELVDRPSAEECFNWLDDLLKELGPDTAKTPIVCEASILKEVGGISSTDSTSSSISDSISEYSGNVTLSRIDETPEGRTLGPGKIIEAPGRGKGYKLAGYVVKRGGRIKTWKRRFMVLTEDGLHYYKSMEDFQNSTDLSRQGSILFSEMVIPPKAANVCDLVPILHTGKKYSIRIMTKARARYVSAPDQKSAERWVQNINMGQVAWLMHNEIQNKIVI